MFRTNAKRDGFALPVAVFALVVVGVLVTGGFYVARQESRIGVASDKGMTAFYIAEKGISDIFETWNASTYGALDVQESTIRTGTTSEGSYRVSITKLSDWIFYIDSRGTVEEGGPLLNGATRRVGTLAKIRTIDMRPPAALTTVGQLTVGGASQVVGYDSIPPTWGGLCDPSRSTDAPGIMIDAADSVHTSGSRYELVGDPSIDEDPSMTSEDLINFDDFPWEELVSMATVRIPGATNITQTQPDSVLVGGGTYVCNTANAMNWGDPLNPSAVCGNHFPVIYAQGDLSVQSGDFGQGIMLVEGDLKLNGGYSFFGPVIVKGTVATAGTGGHFYGGLIAANVELSTTTVLGDALVQYSSCAVTRALLNNAALAIARPLADRSWVDLSNVMN